MQVSTDKIFFVIDAGRVVYKSTEELHCRLFALKLGRGAVCRTVCLELSETLGTVAREANRPTKQRRKAAR